MRWGDIDLEGARINVRRQITSTDYIVRQDESKSDRGLRVITIDAGTVEALRTMARHPSGKSSWMATGTHGIPSRWRGSSSGSSREADCRGSDFTT